MYGNNVFHLDNVIKSFMILQVLIMAFIVIEDNLTSKKSLRLCISKFLL